MVKTLRNRFAALLAAGLLAGSAFAGGEGWTEDFASAQQTAESEGKDLLIDFTGSDWCGWCIKLNQEVFSHDEFKVYAPEHFVLVELDYPSKKPQSDELKAQNAALRDKYGISGYPTILLADAQGRPYAKTGYRAGGPESYTDHLDELRAIRVKRDENFAAAEKAEGIEKAKLLFAGLQVVGDDLAIAHYKPLVEEAMALDADGEAGIKAHYEELVVAKEQRAAMEAIARGARADAPGTVAKLDEFLAREDLVKAIRQEALASKSQIQLFVLEDKATAKATLLEAIAVDPESEMGKMLTGALARFFPEGE